MINLSKIRTLMVWWLLIIKDIETFKYPLDATLLG
jgi:uncharacterized protein YhhL (DUF1145 family)